MSKSNKTLLVSGCSYTFGQEIYDAVHELGNLKPSKHAWPCVYAELAGYDNVINLAQPGESNHYIARSIINRATELLAKNIEFDIAVLWTFEHRTEYYDNNEWRQLGLWHTSKSLFTAMLQHLSADHWAQHMHACQQLVEEFATLHNIEYRHYCLDPPTDSNILLFGHTVIEPAGIKSSEFPNGPNGHPLEDAQAHAAGILYEKWNAQ